MDCRTSTFMWTATLRPTRERDRDFTLEARAEVLRAYNAHTEFVERQSRERLEKAKLAGRAVASWNSFNSRLGSIADEYSSL